MYSVIHVIYTCLHAVTLLADILVVGLYVQGNFLIVFYVIYTCFAAVNIINKLLILQETAD